MGGNKYHDFELLFEKRYSQGLQTTVMYTYSYAESQDFYYNEFDAKTLLPAQQPQPPPPFRVDRHLRATLRQGPQVGPNRPAEASGRRLAIELDLPGSKAGPPRPGPTLLLRRHQQHRERLQAQRIPARDVHLWFDPNLAYRGSGAIPSGFTGFEGRRCQPAGRLSPACFPRPSRLPPRGRLPRMGRQDPASLSPGGARQH